MASATSAGSIIFESRMVSSVRPCPMANSVLTPPGKMVPTLMLCLRSSASRDCAKPDWANLVAQ
jgi:hypothetical protein